MDRNPTTLPGCCGVCRADELELLSTVDRYQQNLQTAVCRRCGMVQHAKIPSQQELSDFYTSDYRVAYNGEASPSDRRVYREWYRGIARFESLKSFVKPGDNVFEVGSGIGCNLKQFEAFGCSVRGIEPGEGFSQYSIENLGLDVRCAFLEELEAEANQDQSLVLLVHVLEHLPDPVDALQRIGKLMRPDGKLYIEVPNFGLPHAAPDRVFHYGHIYNFTEISLRNVAQLAGFTAEEVLLDGGRLPNLAYVLTPDPSARHREIVNGYELAISAYHRFTPLSYRLRVSKLVEAAKKVSQQVSEWMLAKRKVRQILAAAKPSAQQLDQASQATRKAA